MKKKAVSGIMLTLLLIGMLTLAFNILQAKSLEAPPTEWSRTYGISGNHDEAHSLIQTDDGGYAMLGFTQHYYAGHVYTSDFWLVKTDPAGNVEWNRTYGAPSIDNLEWGQSVVQTDDGGYAMAGIISTDGGMIDWDFWLVKADADGNMMWNQTYGGADRDFGHCVVMTGDGGYAVAGRTASFGAGDDDFWLVKTDADGNMMWNQTYGGMQIDIAHSMVQTSDGGYALLGWTNSFGATDYWLVKTDPTGNMEWYQTYGEELGDTGYAVVQTVDGGYAMAGESNYYINSSYAVIDVWLVKTCSLASILAEVDIIPDTLNLKSKGKWITAYIQLPDGYDPVDIDATTILLNETIPPVLNPKYDFVTDPSEYIVDHDGDGLLERMVKFNRTEVASWIVDDLGIEYGSVALIITGELFDGTHACMGGTGTIKVLFPGDVDDDGAVTSHDFSIFAGCYGTNIENPIYNPMADFNEDGCINSEDFSILAGYYGRTAV